MRIAVYGPVGLTEEGWEQWSRLQAECVRLCFQKCFQVPVQELNFRNHSPRLMSYPVRYSVDLHFFCCGLFSLFTPLSVWHAAGLSTEAVACIFSNEAKGNVSLGTTDSTSTVGI